MARMTRSFVSTIVLETKSFWICYKDANGITSSDVLLGPPPKSRNGSNWTAPRLNSQNQMSVSNSLNESECDVGKAVT